MITHIYYLRIIIYKKNTEMFNFNSTLNEH